MTTHRKPDSTTLLTLSEWASGTGRLAERSRIILLSARGKSAEDIAVELGAAVATVYKWRRRFRENGLAGLRDLPRPGQPRRLCRAQREEIIRWTVARLSPDGDQWTIRSLASALNVTEHQVREVWGERGLKPHQLRRAVLGGNGELVGRNVQLLGVYIGPPLCAVALGLGPQRASLVARKADPASLPKAPHGILHSAYRVAAQRATPSERRVRERRGELEGFLRAMLLRNDGRTLHFFLSPSAPCARDRRHLQAAITSPVSFESVPTNQAWICALQRWLHASDVRATSTARDLLASLAQHASDHAPDRGASFAWIANVPGRAACTTSHLQDRPRSERGAAHTWLRT